MAAHKTPAPQWWAPPILILTGPLMVLAAWYLPGLIGPLETAAVIALLLAATPVVPLVVRGARKR